MKRSGVNIGGYVVPLWDQLALFYLQLIEIVLLKLEQFAVRGGYKNHFMAHFAQRFRN